MRRIHQPDGRVVEVAGEKHVLEDLGTALADLGHDRHLGQGTALLAEVDPQIALHLAARVALHVNAGEIGAIFVDEGRNGRAPALGIEAPAVIAALDLAAVEAAVRKRNAAMGTETSEREGPAIARPAEQQRLAEKGHPDRSPRLQTLAGQREVPKVGEEHNRKL